MKLLNVKEVAQLLRIHEKTVYKWVRVGKIPKPINKCGHKRWDQEKTIQTFSDYQSSANS